MKEPNGLATAAEIRLAQEFGEPQRVRLPKLGKDVFLRRPSVQWLAAQSKTPVALGQKKFAITEAAEYVKWWHEFVCAVMVLPHCSMNPGADEIAPFMFDLDDVAFIVQWAYAEGICEVRNAISLSKEGNQC